MNDCPLHQQVSCAAWLGLLLLAAGLVVLPALAASGGDKDPDPASLSVVEQTLSREMISAGQALEGEQDVGALSDWAVGRVGAYSSSLVRDQAAQLLPDTFTSNRYLSVVEQSVLTAAARLPAVAMGRIEAAELGEQITWEAARGMLDTAIGDLKAQSWLPFTTLELEYDIGEDREPQWSAMGIAPLYESEDLTHTLFTQLRHERGGQGTTNNIGLGYRYLTENYLYGLHGFYDHASQYDHNRLSIGAEIMANTWSVTANRYVGLSDWRVDPGDPGIRERVQSGWDVELGGRHPALPGVEAFARLYEWENGGNRGDLTGQEYSLEYTPISFLTLMASVTDEAGQDLAVEGGLRLNLTLGQPIENPFATPQLARHQPLAERRLTRIRRQNRVRAERISADSGPAPLGPVTGFSQITSLSTPDLDGADNVTIDGTTAYVPGFLADSLTAIDISDPTNLTPLDSLSTPDLNGVIEVAIDGNTAYVTSQNADSLTAIDISDPTNLTPLDSLSTADLNGARGVAIDGNTAYVASFTAESLTAIDISDPSNLTPLDSLSTANMGGASGVAIDGQTAYVPGAVADSLTAIDISNPTNLTPLDSLSTADLDGARNVAIDGNTAYIASFDADSLTAIDISDPANLSQLATISTADLDGAFGVAIDGQTAYVASFNTDSLTSIEILRD